MKKLSVKPKNWLVSLHVASGGLWLGAACCIVATAIVKRNTLNSEELYGINSVLKFMDDWVIIPSAMLSLVTGGLLCWLTIWGFTKHYWVIVKWVVTIILIMTGTIWLGPWLNAMTELSDVERLQPLHSPIYLLNQQRVIVGGLLQTGCLLAIIALSVLKPWGRRLTQQPKETQ